MKKTVAVILILFFALIPLSSCGSKSADLQDAVDVLETPAPSSEGVATQTAYGHSAGVKINASVAFAYEGLEGVTVYGAVEYENTGDCPIYISGASFTFTIDGADTVYDFEPALSEYTVVLPGCISYEAVWLTGRQAGADSEISLRASLTAVEAPAPRVSLEVDNLYTADNYPGFSTLSGRISCSSETGCSANLVYIGFYDASGAFLGAWYFSKNAVIEHGDPKNFVINMQELPIDGLAAKVASYKSAAFGFEF